MLEKTTTLKRYLNSGLLTQSSSLISPGCVQGFLVTKTSPSMISDMLSIELMVSAYSILFALFLIPCPCLSILKLSLLIYTKISFSSRVPVGSTTPIRTHESGSKILDFFFKLINWFSCILCKIEDRIGSLMTSKPLIKAYFKVAWKLLHGSTDNRRSFARSLSLWFFMKV